MDDNESCSASLRQGLTEAEEIGERRAASSFAMHELDRHTRGQLIASKARVLRQEIDRLERLVAS